MSWLKRLGGALLALLLGALGVLRVQRDRAREEAQRQEQAVRQHEARAEQREKVTQVQSERQEAAHEAVEQVREEARSGRRDHFSRGMRDDD